MTAKPETTFIDVGFRMHVRDWRGVADAANRPILLVHGLASNAKTWDGVARELSAHGHPVVAIDQRGHGLSEKLPVESGYDFDTINADLLRLLDQLGWERPIMIGQSWGGNVMLAFGAAHPQRAAGYVWVDGGFLAVRQRAPVWEEAYEIFKPPPFNGVQRAAMVDRLRRFQPDWSAEGIEGTLGNFQELADGSVTPWLTLERHMTIFRALWEQTPDNLFPLVQEPVLICPATSDAADPAINGAKRARVATASAALPNSSVHWFEQTAHDIHVHRPVQLAAAILDWAAKHHL